MLRKIYITKSINFQNFRTIITNSYIPSRTKKPRKGFLPIYHEI